MKPKVLTAYDPAWSHAFENLRACYAKRLGDFGITIEHVGSTSIEGLPAKPIIDIDIILQNESQLNEVSEGLIRMGYESKGELGIKGRFAFRQVSEKVPYRNPSAAWHEHHLYVCYPDSLALKNHITFRNALRADVKLRSDYARLKWELFENPGIDRSQYNVSKTAFILSVLAAAGFSTEELAEIKAANN